MNTDAGDAGGTDAAADAPLRETPSGVTAAMCARAIDLNAMGTLSGETTSIRGSTRESQEVLRGPCNPIVTGHQVYRYRVRGEAVGLRVTTNLPGGTDLLDTSVWVLQGECAESTPVLECNDDDGLAELGREGTSTFATRSLARGTELYFVVAAYARARRGAQSRGEYTLAVTEVPSVQGGQQCDATFPGACVRGFECVPYSVERGVCTAPSRETEPNNSVSAAGTPRPVTRTLAVHASLMPAGDTDCFAFDIPANSTLWIEASDGGGSCRADIRADLYRAGEMMPIAGDDDTGRASSVACPRIFPTDNPEVRNMAAGTYVLCVRASEPIKAPPMITLPLYSVHVGIVPGAN